MGDIATITNGEGNVQDASLEQQDGFYPFFDRSEELKFTKEWLFDKEAIIYPGEGSEFYPKYYHGRFNLHQRCYAIFDIQEVSAQYLYWYLMTQNPYFVRNAVGSTVPSLRLDTFQKLQVPLLGDNEQRTIADTLHSLQRKLEIEQRLLRLSRISKQHLLHTMFI